jgi:hypothetical protein
MGSIFGPDGQQIVLHRAYGWHPKKADWELMAARPTP